jgi:cytochrome c oxidase subunit 2
MNDFLRRALFLPEQASTIAPAVDHLHFFVIITTFTASAIIGLGALGLFIRYRRRSEIDTTPHITPPTWLEVLIIGLPLTFFLVWFAIGFAQYVRIATPPPNSMEVYVMGKQWMWKFAYPDGPSSIGTLRVPVGRPVKLVMTSRDVIHSFYVPAFRIKQDVLPNRYTQTWFQATQTGTFPIYCAEFCGTDHSLMRGEIVAVREDEFFDWMGEQRRGLASRQDAGPTSIEARPPAESMAGQGQKLATQFACVKCHTIDGSPHIGPTWLDLYHRQETLSNGSTILVDETYMTESMMDPQAKIVAGFGTVMPTFQGRLTAPEAAAIIEYIKTLRSPANVAGEPSKGPTYEPIPHPGR